MKRRNRIAALLAALVLMLSMFPMTAAAVNVYRLTVTISDSGTGATGVRVTDSVNYLTSNTNLVATVGALVASNYYLEDGSVNPASPLRAFRSDAMRQKLEKGLHAYRNGKNIWTEFVTDEMLGASGNLLPLISNFDAKVGALKTNQEYVITYVNPVDDDAKAGVKYTVTVKLTKRSSSKPDNIVEDEAEAPALGNALVIIQKSQNGSADLADSHIPSNVRVGDQVTIELLPEDGYRPNRVVVTDKQGKPISITAVDNNTYTFVVPEGGVIVTPNFILMPTSVDTTGVDRMLNTDPDTAYIQGKADGKFHPSDSITRGQVAAIFYRLLKAEYAQVEKTKSFSDVPADFWCADAVNTLATLGIVNGMNDKEFAPNKPITRAQFVAICARFADAPTVGDTFTDVPESHWAYDYICTGSGYGWINGVGGGLFDPNAPITRAQAVTIVNRMLCRIADRAAIDGYGSKFYPDVTDTHWAWYEIGEASKGILSRGD